MFVLISFDCYLTFNLTLGILFCHSYTWLVKANFLCPYTHNETPELLSQECFVFLSPFQVSYLNYSLPCDLMSLTISCQHLIA